MFAWYRDFAVCYGLAGMLFCGMSIDIDLLAEGRSSRPKLFQYSIEPKMSRASARVTTRPEDLA